MFGLTAKQFDCLSHRLEVPDALAEVFGDEYAEDDVYQMCTLLLAQRLDEARSNNEALMKEVLADCVEGSTWAASQWLHGDNAPAYNGAMRTLRALAKKLEPVIGRKLDVPEY